MSMILDGIIILFMLISIFKGLKNGFIKSIWGLVSLVAIVVCIYFTATPIAKMVNEKTKIDSSVTVQVEKLYGKIKGFDTLVSKDNLEESLETLKDNGAPSLVLKIATPLIKKYAPSGSACTVKTLMAEKSAQLIILIGVGICLIILVGIISNILKAIILSIVKINVIRPVDRLLGLAYCAVVTAAIFIALGGLAYTLKDQKFMKSVNSSADQSVAFKYIYNENPFKEFFEEKVNIGKLVDKYINKKDETEEPDNTTPDNTTPDDTTPDDTTPDDTTTP